MCEIKVDSRRNAILASLRGSEATEAIHKTPKADSREAYFASAKFMDRHADKSARDDRETSKVANPNHTNQAEGFLMRKQGCEAFCAEIRLGRLSHKQKASSLLYRKKPTRGERRNNA